MNWSRRSNLQPFSFPAAERGVLAMILTRVLGAAGVILSFSSALCMPATAQQPVVSAAATRHPELLPGPGTRWSFAAVGDAIINRRLAPFDNANDPRFQEMARIIRGADVAMVNLEMSL